MKMHLDGLKKELILSPINNYLELKYISFLSIPQLQAVQVF